jgi:hypothetical protein
VIMPTTLTSRLFWIGIAALVVGLCLPIYV